MYHFKFTIRGISSYISVKSICALSNYKLNHLGLLLVVIFITFVLLYQGGRLHWEAKRGHKDKVKFLIENGTNVDTKDEEGVSTLCI